MYVVPVSPFYKCVYKLNMWSIMYLGTIMLGCTFPPRVLSMSWLGLMETFADKLDGQAFADNGGWTRWGVARRAALTHWLPQPQQLSLSSLLNALSPPTEADNHSPLWGGLTFRWFRHSLQGDAFRLTVRRHQTDFSRIFHLPVSSFVRFRFRASWRWLGCLRT